MSVRLPESLRPTYPIRSDRLLLRPLTSADAGALLSYRSRQDVCQYVPFDPMTGEVIAGHLAGQWARTELTGEGQSLTLGAEVEETGELAGDLILFWHSREHAGSGTAANTLAGNSATSSIPVPAGVATPPRRRA